MTKWCPTSCQSLDDDEYCVNPKAVGFFHIIFFVMPHLNICHLTASVLRIVLVATKNTALLSLRRMNLLLSLWSKTDKENVVTGVLASSLLSEVLLDAAMKAVAVALSGVRSDGAQAKSHLSLAAMGNVRDLLHLVSPVVRVFGLRSPARCQGGHPSGGSCSPPAESRQLDTAAPGCLLDKGVGCSKFIQL